MAVATENIMINKVEKVPLTERSINSIRSISGIDQDEAVEFNCFATPQMLHEEKLFGYADEEGNEFSGLIDDAVNSILLLVQFEKLSEEAQSGLLNIVLYGKFFRQNGVEEVDTNLRIISITDRDYG